MSGQIYLTTETEEWLNGRGMGAGAWEHEVHFIVIRSVTGVVQLLFNFHLSVILNSHYLHISQKVVCTGGHTPLHTTFLFTRIIIYHIIR